MGGDLIGAIPRGQLVGHHILVEAVRAHIHDRFRDPLVLLLQFADEVLVRCPACGDRAVVLENLGSPEYRQFKGERFLRTRRRLRCAGCGLCKDEFFAGSVSGGAVDPYFGLPLWLQAGCCGHVLWAYNVRHLDVLESYAAARLREGGSSMGASREESMTMLEELPAWLKSAKHRRRILRTIQRMRASLLND